MQLSEALFHCQLSPDPQLLRAGGEPHYWKMAIGSTIGSTISSTIIERYWLDAIGSTLLEAVSVAMLLTRSRLPISE